MSCLLLAVLGLLLSCSSISAQGYYYFNGKYYSTGNHQRSMQEFESKKEKYCASHDFYELLNVDRSELHEIKVDDDYDKFFEPEVGADIENEKKAKQNGKVLKAAWKKVALRMHPDKNSEDKFAEDKFTEVQMAFEVLKEPKARQEYEMIWKGYCGSEKFKRIREEKYRLWNAKKVKYTSNTLSELVKNFLDHTYYRIDLDIRTQKDICPLEKVHIECYRKMVDFFIKTVPYNSLLALILHIFVNFMYCFWIKRTFGNMADLLIMANQYAQQKRQ